MPKYSYPGVYVEELPGGVRPIEGVSTSTAGFVGPANAGPADRASGVIASLAEFEGEYGDASRLVFSNGARQTNWLWHSVRAFFENGGKRLVISRAHAARNAPPDAAAYRAAFSRLESVRGISIVAAPGSTAGCKGARREDIRARCDALLSHAQAMRRFAIVDSVDKQSTAQVLAMRALLDSQFGALYYPWVTVADPATRMPLLLPPSGFVAGIYARVDISRGVFRAPADEVVKLATGLERDISKAEQDVLDPAGVNCLRRFPGRRLRVWSARTLSSDPDWTYVNVRRFFSYLEESIARGTRWVVFEPNAEPVWAKVLRKVQDFLRQEWRAGALQGRTEQDAFFVKCDRTTMTQDDIDNGRLICEVGVATVKPAEFVILRFQHKTSCPPPA